MSRDVPWGEYLLKYHAEEQKAGSSASRQERAVGVGGIPIEYDIRDIDGVSYASIDRNQHSPSSCESSWAQAAISALNDRFALLKGKTHPQIVLSVQVKFISNIVAWMSTRVSRFC